MVTLIIQCQSYQYINDCYRGLQQVIIRVGIGKERSSSSLVLLPLNNDCFSTELRLLTNSVHCITHNIQLNIVIPQYLEAQRTTRNGSIPSTSRLKPFIFYFNPKLYISFPNCINNRFNLLKCTQLSLRLILVCSVTITK